MVRGRELINLAEYLADTGPNVAPNSRVEFVGLVNLLAQGVDRHRECLSGPHDCEGQVVAHDDEA